MVVAKTCARRKIGNMLKNDNHKFFWLNLLVPLMVLLALSGCPLFEDSDDEMDGLFKTATVWQEDEEYLFKDVSREGGATVIFVKNIEDSLGNWSGQVMQLDVQDVEEDGTARTKQKTIGTLNPPDGKGIDALIDALGNVHVLARKSDNSAIVHTNYGTGESFDFGEGLIGLFWMGNSSISNVQGQALIVSASRSSDSTGVVSVGSDIHKVSLWDYQIDRTEKWRKLEGAFTDLAEGEQILGDARNLVAVPSLLNNEPTNPLVTDLAFIDEAGQIVYLKGRWSSAMPVDGFRFVKDTVAFSIYNARKRKTHAFDFFFKPYANEQLPHACAVAEREGEDERADLYVFSPWAGDSMEIDVEDIYLGNCSVSYFRVGESPIQSWDYEWVAYRSEKNELSVSFRDQRDKKPWLTTFIDKNPVSAWHFATRFSIGLVSKANLQMRLFYAESEGDLKAAFCANRGICGQLSYQPPSIDSKGDL